MSVKKITIYIENGSIKVTRPIVKLHKAQKDTIQWKTRPANRPFLVCFCCNSPFSKNHFYDGAPNSGSIRAGGRGFPSIYKYSVEFGGKRLDPGVIIEL